MHNITLRVPQGFHLVPLLFHIYIYDINSKILLFADEVKLFRIIKTPLDTKLLQDDLKNISNWCGINKLYLNISKYKVITFTKKR
jgi:hypothetical protein